MGLLDKVAKTDMVLMRPFAIEDGKEVFENIFITGALFDFSQADINYFGRIDGKGTVYIAPFEGTVDTSCKLSINDVVYTIKAVKTFRNIKSVLQGYKVVI